jgi:hypothetical protein
MLASKAISGLVKTHFYHIWVQGKVLRKTKELRGLHKILAEVVCIATHDLHKEY